MDVLDANIVRVVCAILKKRLRKFSLSLLAKDYSVMR